MATSYAQIQTHIYTSHVYTHLHVKTLPSVLSFSIVDLLEESPHSSIIGECLTIRTTNKLAVMETTLVID